MHLTWSQWTIIVCAIVALLLAFIGAMRAFAGLKKTRWRATEVLSRIAAMRLDSGQRYIDRINKDIAKMPVLIERANVALEVTNRSLKALTLPEAISALRTAAAAVKLLFSGR